MTEAADSTTTVSPPQPEFEGTIPKVADVTSDVASKLEDLTKEAESEKKPEEIPFRIWPLNQKGRDSNINFQIRMLTTKSIFTDMYGKLELKEASAVAKSIEEEVYGVAPRVVESAEDQVNILDDYHREIASRVMAYGKKKLADSKKRSREQSKDDSKDDAVPPPNKKSCISSSES